MITITFKNGSITTIAKETYTEYRYYKEVFVTIKNKQWVGIYSMDEIRMIEVAE